MCSSRLYATKLNSMPKLEFAISESPTGPPHRAANSLICLLLFLHSPLSSFLRTVCCLSLVSIANTKSWFQSWCISRSRHTAKFRPKVRSGFASGSGLPDTARAKHLSLSPSNSLHFFFFFFLSFLTALANLRKQKQAGGAPPTTVRPARLHKYYANIRSGPVTPRARTRETVTFLLSCAAPFRSTRKVSLLISTEICATRVSPLSPRDSWHFAYAA